MNSSPGCVPNTAFAQRPIKRNRTESLIFKDRVETGERTWLLPGLAGERGAREGSMVLRIPGEQRPADFFRKWRAGPSPSLAPPIARVFS